MKTKITECLTAWGYDFKIENNVIEVYNYFKDGTVMFINLKDIDFKAFHDSFKTWV